MSIKMRQYQGPSGITEDYHKVREFFSKLGYAEYTFARWDWMITHTYLDETTVTEYGLWEEDGQVVGVVTADGSFGEAFCLTLKGYEHLKKEMLTYAENHLASEREFGVLIGDDDSYFQRIAAEFGYMATGHRESDAVFLVDETSMDYELEEGFKIVSLKDNYDVYQYGQILWKGFNHEKNGEGIFELTKEKEEAFSRELKRYNVDLNLKVAVVAPDGDFVSYCGMWYDEEAGYGVIEPVATDPDYRRKGLGKAAVLEGIRRVADRGAKEVYVGSNQQFYYSLGMRPYKGATKWIKRQRD